MSDYMFITYPDGTTMSRNYISGRGLKNGAWGGRPIKIEVTGKLEGKQRAICLSHTSEVYVNGERIHD